MKKLFLTTPLLIFTLTACSKPIHDASQDIQTTEQTQAAALYEAATPTMDQDHTIESNLLDLEGTYSGLFPCADYAGIETTLELKSDSQYKLIEIYQGKKIENLSYPKEASSLTQALQLFALITMQMIVYSY